MPRRRSIRTQLLSAISAIMVLGLGVVLFLDYRSEKAERLAEKRIALQDEAVLLLPMIGQLRHHGVESVQRYLDEACAQIQETTSPGHHIAVELDDVPLQARTHHRASPEMLYTMKLAVQGDDGFAMVGSKPILVGSAFQGDISAYVSEYVSNVLDASRQQLWQRSAAIGAVGLVATGLTNLLLIRLVAKPVDRLVAVVRQIAEGQSEKRTSLPSAEFNSAEFQFLAHEVAAMSTSLAEADRRRRQQIEKAQRIQQRLHPRDETAGGYRIASLYRPADEVGGDYLDFKYVQGLLVACVADVSGHGVSAAMGAAMLKTLFDSALRQSSQPGEILKFINEGFGTVSLDEDFASMIVVLLDHQRCRLVHASAGHEPAYLLRGNGDPLTLQSTGPLLGIQTDVHWDDVQTTIAPGDRLALLTDGWAETQLNDGQLLGRQALLDILSQGSTLTPKEQTADALARLSERSQAVPSDDLTLLLIDWPHADNVSK